MTEVKTYPREWFRVSGWSNEPFARMFERETDAFLICDDDRRVKKWTDYDRWYPTREEAQAVIDERKADKAERERMNKIRDAAPDLLEALQEAEWFVAHYAEYVASVPVDEIERHPYLPDLHEKVEIIRAAIAKATT